MNKNHTVPETFQSITAENDLNDYLINNLFRHLGVLQTEHLSRKGNTWK